MNCVNCKAPLDSQKSGFMVCPKCGTVNVPERAPHRLPHHIIHTTKPSKLWHRIYQHRLFAPGAAILFVVVLNATTFALQGKKDKAPETTNTPVISKNVTKPPATQPAPSPAPIKKPGKKPTPAAAPTPRGIPKKVLVLKYFPLTANGANINVSVTGDVGNSYPVIRQRTVDITNNLVSSINRATKYLGYKNLSAPSSLNYSVVATKEYTYAVPIKASHNIPSYPDYYKLLSDNNVCGYVNGQHVDEVWIWAYQGPDKANGYPSLAISESKMSGPYGDISNSWRFNDMPQCGRTYQVYTYNYGRGTAEALHSWSHQIEAELTEVDNNLFRNLFEGTNWPQTKGVAGRCGSVHNPPNARSEYDYANPTPQRSDCMNWQANGTGALTNISCQIWGCSYISDTNNSQLNWLVWWLQNLPGQGNTKTYNGKQMRNWWDVHANFDAVMSSNRSLTL